MRLPRGSGQEIFREIRRRSPRIPTSLSGAGTLSSRREARRRGEADPWRPCSAPDSPDVGLSGTEPEHEGLFLMVRRAQPHFVRTRVGLLARLALGVALPARRRVFRLARIGVIVLASGCGSESEPPSGPDVQAPSPILDLLAQATDADSALLLSWTAPGDDGDHGRAARYEIRYSLQPPASADWEESLEPTIGPVPSPAGSPETWVLYGLLPDSTYYVRIRSEDEALNRSPPSNVASGMVGDAVAPAAITDLRVSGMVTASRVELRWTMTGDDGMRGPASRSEMRVASAPLDAANWEEAEIVDELPQAAEPGVVQSLLLTELQASRTYYFAIRAIDDAGNLSPIASSLRVETPAITVRASDGSETRHPSVRAALAAVRENETISLGPGIFDGPENRDLEPNGLRITIRGAGASETGTVFDLERAGRAFYFHRAGDTGTVVQGVLIRNGFATDTAPGFGGAVFCFGGASPTLVECVFEGNEAVARGGAVAARAGSSPLISQCEFRGNRSGIDGGALEADEMSRLGITSCLFENNEANGRGGAIALLGNSGGEVRDCDFRDNHAGEFGGAIAAVGSSPLISDCSFQDNDAVRGGGAILCLEGSSPTLDGCLFRGNEGGDWGGAIYCLVGSSPVIDGSIFEGNSAVEGGAILAFRDSLPTLAHSTLVRNRACFGTAVRCVEVGSGVRIDRSILAFGAVPECSGGVGLAIHLQDGATAAVSCTDIFGNAGGDWVRWLEGQESENGNIAADPRFCDVDSGDFRLRNDSPCLDRAGCGLIGALGSCGELRAALYRGADRR